MRTPSFRRPIVSMALAVLFCFSTFGYAFAGTSGALTGDVRDASSGAAIADAIVTVTSASQYGSATTDAGGHFAFISLAPDTYTLSVQKSGFDPASTSGVSVLADQTQNLPLTLHRALRVIGRVTSRSSIDPVKPGTTIDVYSVNPAIAAAAAPLGGGGSLNNAYSGIAAVPGAFVPPGQMGVNQSVYIRGGYYDQIGYEYDGVPVNRSFDNYPGHSASSLGQQELQIYTGGGGAGATATGLAGFINQVTKSGTYPGYGFVSTRVGSPTFYHDFSAEFAGASPNRLFSYYLGTSGDNQDFRYFDNNNGAGIAAALFPYAIGPSNLTTNLHYYPAVYPNCEANMADPFADPASGLTFPGNSDPGCFSFINPVYSSISAVRDRQGVANFHFGIPHKRDGGRDDVQLLFTSSAQYRQYYSGVNDAGPSVINGLVAQGLIDPPHWPDRVTLAPGTAFMSPADSAKVIPYYFPGSPTQRCANVSTYVPGACHDQTFAPLPSDYRDARWDTASIFKAQYQKNIGSNAYIRLFGYTFYSNTNRSGASRRGIGSGFGATNYDYEVNSHTRGAELQFGDQLSAHHQLTGTLNYVTANTFRTNNFNYFNSDSTAISNLTDGKYCYAWQDSTADNGIDTYTAGQRAPCNDSNTQGTFSSPTNGGVIPPGAAAAGASWRITYTGNQAAINSVTPAFTGASLTDAWRPSERLYINLGLRFDHDRFTLASTNSPGKNFWFGAAQQEYCYDPNTLLPVFVPQSPQNFSRQVPYVTFNCPVNALGVQTVHPDGLNGHLLLSNNYAPTITQSYLQPRLGMTYTVNPDTVLRFSAGRYIQQPQNYEIQYNSREENLANQLLGFLPYGFTTPRHDPLAQISNNIDFSYERHFTGTDMSIKLTPYYRYSQNQLYGVASVAGSSPSLNTGVQRSTGLEVQLTKGDFNRDGLSGLFSYTFLNSKERWANFAGTNRNPVDIFNDYITQFNGLTQGGGGAPCYDYSTSQITPDPTCSGSPTKTVIRNPYYNSAPQPLFAHDGWYQTGLDVPYTSPHTFAVVLNYRKSRLAITPAFTLNAGTYYGSPGDVIGIDPRTCRRNQENSGIAGVDPLTADYTTCKAAPTSTGNLYIPNPETGHFDAFGEFRQPWQFNMGAQISYDVSPRVRANMTVANLVNRCFGGSKQRWSTAYPPSDKICGYGSNIFYISNFYNGTSPNDSAANGVGLNPYFAHPFIPTYGDASAFNYNLPLNIYFQVQIKI